MNLPSFDIVIPSVGEPSLYKLLDFIASSTIFPNRVIIVIRDIDSFSYDPTMYPYPISLLHSPARGQVNQRIFGFLNSRSSLVMQIDADCSFDSYFLNNYITEFLRLESKCDSAIAVAPSFIDSKSRLMFSNENRFSLYYRILLGMTGLLFPNKNLSKFGQNFPLNLSCNLIAGSSHTFCSDWLPGGCVLQRKNKLIVDNYYPFPGKAYAEDLFHSYLLFSNSVSLFVLYGISITTDMHPILHSYRDFFKSLSIYLRVSRCFCSFTGFPRILSFLICIPYIKSFTTLSLHKVLCFIRS